MHGALEHCSGEDVLMKHIEIAFADLTDYVEVDNVIVTQYDEDSEQRVPIIVIDTESGEDKPLKKSIVRLKSDTVIDGTLLTEISQGKDGVKVKLADRHKSLEFLAKHFDITNAENEPIKFIVVRATPEENAVDEDDEEYK